MGKFDLEAQCQPLDSLDAQTLRSIVSLGQQELVAAWPPPGEATDDKMRMLAHWRRLDNAYPGGLAAYLSNARVLLEAAHRGDNPNDGYVPRVPAGIKLSYGAREFSVAENLGVRLGNRTAFVLVAGGLGERLGYGGVKVELPAETVTGRPFLQLYIEHILALQEEGNRRTGERRRVPMAIMTSDDTYTRTRELLVANAFYGLHPSQVTLLKQDKVAALRDDSPTIAISSTDPYSIATKPHGHGDVHMLLHQHDLAKKWLSEGIQWVLFFQDTNALTFHAVPAAIGTSQQERLAVNSVTVPRRPGEAVGAIVRLEPRPGSSKRELTVNVEYNQLDGLMRDSTDADGDEATSSGESPYPGNANILIMELKPYVDALQRSGGAVPEFVNPKYADAERSRFKSPTRVECMMQDFPRLLRSDAKVGFTQFQRPVCFSPVKNDIRSAAAKLERGLYPESAGSAEADLYTMHRRALCAAGASIDDAAPQEFGGLQLHLAPMVVLSPSLLTRREPEWKVRSVHISGRATLVLDCGALEIDGLELDGALVVRAVPGAHVTLRGLNVTNRGWEAQALGPAASLPEAIRMRGFQIVKRDTRLIEFAEPGEYVVTV